MTTLYNVCSVPSGEGGVQYHEGRDILSTMGVYNTMGDIMSNVGDILSTVGRYHDPHGGYHE